jgi:hypothetical protein
MGRVNLSRVQQRGFAAPHVALCQWPDYFDSLIVCGHDGWNGGI